MNFSPYPYREEWRDVPGYEGLYSCNRAGQVRGPRQVLRQVNHSRGYKQVTLCKAGVRRVWLVHRLVALTWLPNPAGLPCINHKNEDKADNRVENLEWCTVKYNNNYGDRVQRIAEKHRGLRHSPEVRRRMSEAHRNISEETRRKLSAANSGRKAGEATRRKISENARRRRRGADGRWICEVHPVPIPAGRD